MATNLGSEAVTISTNERTYSVERQTPRSGPADWRILVHREIVKSLSDGTVLSAQALPDAVFEPIAVTAQRPCFAKFLSRLGLKSVEELVAAESDFYDELVAEVRADRLTAE